MRFLPALLPQRPTSLCVEAASPAPPPTRRRLFFGDLHIHTSYSFDAHAFDVRHTPDAYRFCAGGAAPATACPDGEGTQTVQLSARSTSPQ